jgi:ubiquitin-activating enzyme E1
MCTLRNFPSLIEHCIEWGRDKFNGLFVDGPSDLVSYLDNTAAFNHRMKTTETTSTFVSALQKNIDLLNFKKEASFDLCVAFAKDQFNTYFDYGIQDLLSTFPKDAKDKEGNPFWSGPKRCPTNLTFDASNPDHINFIVPAANLIAVSLGLPECRDVAKIAEIADKVACKQYVKKTVKIEEEKKDGQAQPAQPQPAVSEIEDDKAMIEKLSAELENLVKGGIVKDGVTPAEFEKDDDSNFHIDFINAAANLRATNYEIKNCDRNKTKMIAGKIIPAIATTTAMITGQVTSEIYKVVQGYTKLEDMRNSFINLALPLFALSEPMPVNKIKDKDYDPIAMAAVKSIPGEYTIYDKITIDEGSMTIQQLFDWLDAKYGIEVYLLACGDYSLYNGFLPGKKHAPRLEKKIEDVYLGIEGSSIPDHKKYLIIVPGGTIKESGDDFQIPPLKYVFKK